MNNPQYGLVNYDVKMFFQNKKGYTIDGITFYNRKDYNEYVKQVNQVINPLKKA
jgi:hypothetical protein